MKRFALLVVLLTSLVAYGAEKKFTDLTLLPGASLANDDVFAVVDISANETKKVRLLDVNTFFDGKYLTGLSGDGVAAPGTNTLTINGLLRSKIANGTIDHVLINSGTGALSSEAQLAKTRGGTGISSTATFPSTGTVTTNEGVQQLTNKDIVGGTASSTNRLNLPKNTKANLDGLSRRAGDVVFATDSAKAFLDNGSALVSMGGGGGGGGKNYLTDANCESGVFGQTFANANALTGTLQGGAPTATVTTTTTLPLAGLASCVYTPGAQFNGWSGQTDTVDREDLGNVMEGLFLYEFTTPASYVAGDLRLALYDGAGRIAALGAESIPAATGLGKMKFKFIITNATTYRVGFVQTTSNVAYGNVKFETKFGPQTPNPTGVIATETNEKYPLTNQFASSSLASTSYRLGDRLHGNAQLLFTAANAQGQNQFLLPSSIQVDYTKLKFGAGGFRASVGQWFSRNSGSGAVGSGSVIMLASAPNALTLEGVWPASNLPHAFPINSEISFDFDVPIAGWEVGTVLSTAAENSGRELTASVFPNGGQVLNSGVQTKLTLNGSLVDTATQLDLTNSRILIKEAGNYLLMGSTVIEKSTGTTSIPGELALWINGTYAVGGVTPDAIASSKAGNYGTYNSFKVYDVRPLKAGDYVEFFQTQTSGTTTTVSSGRLIVTKISSGSQTLAYQYSAPQVFKFTAGSGNFTVPNGASYVKIRGVGGGGGGGGSAGNATNGGTGANGGDTIFGSVLVGYGGSGNGNTNTFCSANGGLTLINSPANGSGFKGGDGAAASYVVTTSVAGAGGHGGSSIFGGSGRGSVGGNIGFAGAANTGGGGGGASIPQSTNQQSIGCGGAAGGGFDANVPVKGGEIFAYVVGVGGNGGTAGSNGSAGGRGGDGYLEITVFFSNIGEGSIPQNTVSTTNATGAKAEWWFASNTCSSSPCADTTKKSGSWLTSVTRGAAGNYTFNFAPGAFADQPNCSYAGTGVSALSSLTNTYVTFQTYNVSSGTLSPGDGYPGVTCVGAK